MGKQFNGFLILFLSIGLVTLLIDVGTGKTGSTFTLFISLVNVIVMGVLTYYIYIVNKRVVEISEGTLKITSQQMINLEMKETNHLLGKLDEYINHNDIIKKVTLLHLPISEKHNYLQFESNNMNLDKEYISKSDWNRVIWKTDYELTLNDKEKEMVKYIESRFNNEVPSGVKARLKLKDLKESYKYLLLFKSDVDFYRFKKNSELPKDIINILEIFMDRILVSNIDDNSIYPNLLIDRHDAKSIYLASKQINSFLENLKGLIIEEQLAVKNNLSVG
ncbi:hypothetical protein [Peribacillus sp. TH14]|uniref:hypothetical protein n=1 Tax=Peribacillus sp. TH14 TaxID=2798481 RepID=UPI0019116C00|nr:hypothetical protein [Peribacillus sp. TH14]MBK5497425.1 hypothetical protein [Peribacillus sp. TH14]